MLNLNLKSKKEIGILIIAIVIVVAFFIVGDLIPRGEEKWEGNNISIQIPKTDIKIILPDNHQQESIVHYEDQKMAISFDEFYNPNHFDELENFPIISSISLSTGKSISDYINQTSKNSQDLIKKMDNLYFYYEQKRRFDLEDDFLNFKFRKIGDRSYHVSERICQGDIYGCTMLMYTTFLENIKIDISIGFYRKATNEQMDELVSQIKIVDENQETLDISESLRSWYEKSDDEKMRSYIDENGYRRLSEYANNKRLEYTCISQEEGDLMVRARDEFNKMTTEITKYSNFEKGISLDFGKYGFDEKNGSIYFGPKFLYGGGCGLNESRSYKLMFTESRTKEEIIGSVKGKEYDDISDGRKLLEIRKINNFDVVIWKEWGGLPTLSFYFEIPGKGKNYFFEIIDSKSEDEDFEFVLGVIKTIELLEN